MRRILSITMILCCFAVPLYAQVDQAQEIAELKEQIALLTDRLTQIEQSMVVTPEVREGVEIEQTAATPSPLLIPGSWAEKIRLSGDLRYRHETVNDEVMSVRNRHRIRARANLTADLNENVTVGVGLSTGGTANDSGNQTLGSGFSRKPIGMDLAYFDWRVSDTMNLMGGKMSNPFFRPAGYHLIYDSDIRPEGLALKYSSGTFFGNASAFWVEERPDGSDSVLFGLQAGYQGVLNNGANLIAGASYYKTSHTQRYAPIFTPGNGQGNQLDANGNYLFGFSEVELFGELKFDLGGEPMSLFLDYVTNVDADVFNKGFAFGVTYRFASALGGWTVGYLYQDLEANAVVGAFTDSDFAGGTSDGSGHTLRAGYTFSGGWNLATRYIIGDRGRAAGNERDYNRLQADINFRY